MSSNELLRCPTVCEGMLYETAAQGVKCKLCERRCLIAPGKRGYCGTRTNVEGRLYTLTYGDISALESRPIEIKPFFHFYYFLTVNTGILEFRITLSATLPSKNFSIPLLPNVPITIRSTDCSSASFSICSAG